MLTAPTARCQALGGDAESRTGKTAPSLKQTYSVINKMGSGVLYKEFNGSHLNKTSHEEEKYYY